MPRILRRGRKGVHHRKRATGTRRRGVSRHVSRRRRPTTRGVPRRRYVRGKGAYSFSNSRIAQKIPQFGAGGEGVTYISNREQIGWLRTSGTYSGLFELATLSYKHNGNDEKRPCYFRVNAGSELLLPWGSGIARKYEQYKITGFVLTFESTVNTQNSGWTSMPELIMSSMDNPFLDPPTNSQDMKIQPLSAQARVDRNLTAGVECHPARMGQSGWKYVVPIDKDGKAGGNTWMTNIGSRQETDHGVIAIGIEGGSTGLSGTLENQTLGRVYATYRLQLMRPIGAEQAKSTADKFLTQNQDSTITKNKVPHNNGTGDTTRSATAQAIDTEPNDAGTNSNCPETSYLAANNAQHPEYNDNEYKNYYDIVIPGGLTTTTPYVVGFGTATSWTGGQPRGYAKFLFQDVLNTATNPAAGECIFEKGCITPMSNNANIKNGTSVLELHQAYSDNLGIRLSNRYSDGNTRAYFMNRPAPGTFMKVTITWSGICFQRTSPNTITAWNAVNKLWTTAVAPRVETAGARNCNVYLDNIAVPGGQLLNGINLGTINNTTNGIKSAAVKANDISTGAAWGGAAFSEVTGARANAHSMFPTYLETMELVSTYYLIFTNNNQTDTNMAYVEFTPLRGYQTRVMSNLSGANANFVTSWPASNATVPATDTQTTAGIQDAAVRYGSRKIEFEAITYHELPEKLMAYEMSQRPEIYTNSDINDRMLKYETRAPIDSFTNTSQLIGRFS